MGVRWPKKETAWIADRVLYVSIPFTWRLPIVKDHLKSKDLFWDEAVVGGPAVRLMPDYLAGMDGVKVDIGDNELAMSKVNADACKTTVGCARKCEFCAVPIMEPEFKKISYVPRPIVCDNNILAMGKPYFRRVCRSLYNMPYVDFNQGLDCRLLDDEFAEMIAKLLPKKTICRLALDHESERDEWVSAFESLRKYEIPKKLIRTYALIGFDASPPDDWKRCEFIEKYNHSSVLPMWYHSLNQLQPNIVTEDQKDLGWTDDMRKEIMGWYYQHRGEKYGG